MRKVLVIALATLGFWGCATSHPCEILISQDHEIRMNGDIVERNALGTALKAKSMPKEQPIVIRADKKAQHQDVVRVLNEVRSAGFTNVTVGNP